MGGVWWMERVYGQWCTAGPVCGEWRMRRTESSVVRSFHSLGWVEILVSDLSRRIVQQPKSIVSARRSPINDRPTPLCSFSLLTAPCADRRGSQEAATAEPRSVACPHHRSNEEWLTSRATANPWSNLSATPLICSMNVSIFFRDGSRESGRSCFCP
jgi:hypothetical protein